MRPLHDLQDAFARAMTSGNPRWLDAELVGGRTPRGRIAIHLRHYQASLTAALCEKFPASAWLVGSERVRDAARAYARRRPPRQPCIAEYGRDFPAFLAAHDGGDQAPLPYLESFAALEWAVGQASIAIESPPCSWQELSRIGPERLLDSTHALQPRVRYMRSRWRIDELMTTYLHGTQPDRFVLVEADTFVEVRGTRGRVQLTRLDESTFVFRAALAEGRALGDAAGDALKRDPMFDAGEAFRELAHAGLIAATALTVAPQESPP